MSFNLIPRFFYTLNFISYLTPFKVADSGKIECLFGKDKYILNFNNARVGLKLLLNSISDKSLKVGVQAYTCYTVFQAIHNAGHEIVFIDLTDEIKLDLNHLKNNLDKIDVLIITHIFGYPDDIDKITNLIGNKIIIEDCSHSFLSKYKRKYTGTLGDAAIFSMGLGKFPPIGSGGFCVVNKPNRFPLLNQEYEKIPKNKLISSINDFLKVLSFSFMMKPPMYGIITRRLGKKLDLKMDFGNKFSFSESKGTLWEQRILKNNLSLFKKMQIKQTENAKALSSLLKMKSSFLNKTNHNTPNHYALPLLTGKRNKLYDKLLENNIETGKHFHKSLEWASEFGYKKGECPNTEKIVGQILTVPIHFGVSKKTIIKIAKIINENS